MLIFSFQISIGDRLVCYATSFLWLFMVITHPMATYCGTRASGVVVFKFTFSPNVMVTNDTITIQNNQMYYNFLQKSLEVMTNNLQMHFIIIMDGFMIVKNL